MAPSKLGFFGIGGTGCNMINEIARNTNYPGGVVFPGELAAFGADYSHLNVVNMAVNRVRIGRRITRGLGCRGDPALGRKCVLADIGLVLGGLCGLKGYQGMEISLDEAKAILAPFKVKLAFFGFSLGGGMGGGGSPEILRISRSLGFRNIVFACAGSKTETRRPATLKEDSLREVRKHSDSIFLLELDRLMAIDRRIGYAESMPLMDMMVAEAMEAVGAYCKGDCSRMQFLDRFFDRKGMAGSFCFEGGFLGENRRMPYSMEKIFLSGSGKARECFFLELGDSPGIYKFNKPGRMARFGVTEHQWGLVGFGF